MPITDHMHKHTVPLIVLLKLHRSLHRECCSFQKFFSLEASYLLPYIYKVFIFNFCVDYFSFIKSCFRLLIAVQPI